MLSIIYIWPWAMGQKEPPRHHSFWFFPIAICFIVTMLQECEHWRGEIIRGVAKKIAEIQNAALGTAGGGPWVAGCLTLFGLGFPSKKTNPPQKHVFFSPRKCEGMAWSVWLRALYFLDPCF